jgi:serine/threonine protein kinase
MIKGKVLGEGTFGIVYSATSPNSRREYAVKRNLTENHTSFIGVLREVDMLTKLRKHPHIIRIECVAFGEPFTGACFSPLKSTDREKQRDDKVHFVFGKAEYDLHSFIYGAEYTDFSLIKRYIVHMLLGVEFMHHQKILHRDLKPSNVLIFGKDTDIFGNANVAKLCDFGLAKPFTYQGYQTPRTVTSWYRAPEIALGYPHYDYKVDVWSLGCIIFEMFAGKALLIDTKDDDDEIVSRILGVLPQALPIRRLRELVTGNKWRQVSLKPMHNPPTRTSYAAKIGLTPEAMRQFTKQAGSFEQLCDLLDHMLTFHWEQRYSAEQALDHPFFAEYRPLILATRKLYCPVMEDRLIIHDCIERRWMSQIAIDIFNNRRQLVWYSPRTIFQAMDLFDRYLAVMFYSTKIVSNAVESDIKGLVHTKIDTQIRFVTCLYLTIKYFSSVHYPIAFDKITQEIKCLEFVAKEAQLVAEEFEATFIRDGLQYDIYRPTLYEAADNVENVKGDYLNDEDIRDLIMLYMNPTINRMTPTELYAHYKANLRGHKQEVIMAPIIPITNINLQQTPSVKQPYIPGNPQPTAIK